MWLVGVVISRYIDILIIMINFPYSTCIRSFLAAASLLLCSFFNVFSVLFPLFFTIYSKRYSYNIRDRSKKSRSREYKNYLIGERSEPHTYRTAAKNIRHNIYTFVRRARAVNARATRKRRTGRLRFNGQYNRLENGYFSSKL